MVELVSGLVSLQNERVVFLWIIALKYAKQFLVFSHIEQKQLKSACFHTRRNASNSGEERIKHIFKP